MGITSQKSLVAESRLPDEIKPVYRRFVEEYAFLTKLRYGRGYVAYEVIADLVLAGWRPIAKPSTTSKV